MEFPDEFEEFRARALSGGSLIPRRRPICHDRNHRSRTPDGRFFRSRMSDRDGDSGLEDRMSPEGQSDILSNVSCKSRDYHADESDVDSTLQTLSGSRDPFEIPRCRNTSCTPRTSSNTKTLHGYVVGGRSGSMSSSPKCIYMFNSPGTKSVQKVCGNINWDWNVNDEDEFFLGEMRPRVCSLPTAPLNNCRNRFIAMSRARAKQDRYKVRSFSLSKHGIVKPEGDRLVRMPSASSLQSFDSGTTSTTTVSPPSERSSRFSVIVCGIHNVGKTTMIKAFSASIGPDRVCSSLGEHPVIKLK